MLTATYGIPRYTAELKPKFPAISALGVLGIAFTALALKVSTIMGSPPLLLLSTLVGKLFFAL